MKVNSVARYGEHLNAALSIEVKHSDLPQDREPDRLVLKVQLARIESNRKRQDTILL